MFDPLDGVVAPSRFRGRSPTSPTPSQDHIPVIEENMPPSHFAAMTGAHIPGAIAVHSPAFPGFDSFTLPKGVPHRWRNISSEPGRLVVILSRGLEQCVQTIRKSPPEKLEAVAASYGCYIVGLPVSP